MREPSSGGLRSRLRQALRSLSGGGAFQRLPSKGDAGAPPQAKCHDPWPGDSGIGRNILGRRFVLAGHDLETDGPPWELENAPRSWRRALHGFAWLRHVRAVAHPNAVLAARALTTRWLERNQDPDVPHVDPEAWAPAVIGERVTAWLRAWPDLYADAPKTLHAAMMTSFGRQTRRLYATAARAAPEERLTALKGLITAALFLPEAQNRLADAERLLFQEIEAQLLRDGGHVSRNPTLLFEALGELGELRNAYLDAGQEIPGPVQSALDRCVPAARFFRHPDGGAAVFNGGGRGNPAHLEQLLTIAGEGGRAPARLPYGGYERLNARALTIVADCGGPPPAPWDQHAHASTAALEICVGVVRLVVNCGALQEANPEWIAVQRSTAAHSTLSIAATNSSALLDSGGFGKRRAVPLIQRQEDERGIWLSIGHDGYAPPFNLRHERRLFLESGGAILRGEDSLIPIRAAQGRSQPSPAFTIRFHLHPLVTAVLEEAENSVALQLAGSVIWRFRQQGATVSIEDSVWLGDGAVKRSTQIALRAPVAADGGAVVKWAFRDETPVLAAAAPLTPPAGFVRAKIGEDRIGEV